MDEEDDDFYDPADAVPAQQPPQQAPSNGKPQEDDEEVEVEDDEVCGDGTATATCFADGSG